MGLRSLRCVLVPTDTEESRACANAICSFLGTEGVSTVVEPLPPHPATGGLPRAVSAAQNTGAPEATETTRRARVLRVAGLGEDMAERAEWSRLGKGGGAP